MTLIAKFLPDSLHFLTPHCSKTVTTSQPKRKLLPCIVTSGLLVFGLAGCEWEDEDDDSSGEGYVKLYNLSEDSPAIYLTIDEDLANESDSDTDDHVETTYSSIAYGSAQSNNALDILTYEYQLAWQADDSTDTDDLTVIYEDSLTITEDTIHLMVLSESIVNPQVTVYNIPEIDDDDDTTNDLFNLRILNMHSDQQAVDFYYSEENQSFNEATLFGQFSYQELSDNQKLDQDDYVFYITLAGSDDVLFRSSSITFAYSSQNIIIVKDNKGAGLSPYVIDKMSDSAVIEYVDSESEAQFRVYNAVASQDELADYSDTFSVHINGVTDEPIVPELPFGEVSESFVLASGDYSVDVTTGEENSPLISNHLLSLVENTNKTLFFYAEQDYIDDDGDGDIDENNDGVIDEIEVNVYSLMIDNSLLTSIYEHEIEIVNLIDSEEFSFANVYFVRQDETIDTSSYNRDVAYKSNSSITLPNNTYQVFVVATDNGSEVILNSFELILDETSKEQYLVLESSDEAPTGYKATLFNQIPEEE